MLAKSGTPFDSDQHLFEIKWDGLRATVYVDRGSYRVVSRRGHDMTERYPELGELSRLPDGTVLDGELVALDHSGKPSFRAVLSRQQARSPLRIKHAAQSTPTTLIAFDLLYQGHESILAMPFHERRSRLVETIDSLSASVVVVSDGVIGPGKRYFSEIVARDLEGLVAKRLNSPYLAGRRSDAWIKIRRRSSLLCAIVGYVPKGDDFESLIIATDDDGELVCVGRVGGGFSESVRDEVNRLLKANEATEPLIACRHAGRWLRAGLFCSVNFLERTHTGDLREPVFERIIDA